MDENWDYVGGSWSDDYGSGHNFSIKTVVNDVVTQIQEIGENTWTDYEGNAQTNKFDFIYDGNWNLISGTEERGQKGCRWNTVRWRENYVWRKLGDPKCKS